MWRQAELWWLWELWTGAMSDYPDSCRFWNGGSGAHSDRKGRGWREANLVDAARFFARVGADRVEGALGRGLEAWTPHATQKVSDRARLGALFPGR